MTFIVVIKDNVQAVYINYDFKHLANLIHLDVPCDVKYKEKNNHFKMLSTNAYVVAAV